MGSENHFSHDRDYKTSDKDPPTFYDFRENARVAKEYKGKYSTVIFKERSQEIIRNVAEARDLNAYGNYQPFFLYLSLQATHAPLQARAEIMAKIPQSSNPARDIYKAMVYDVDLAVDEIVKTLKANKLYDDTVIVFTSDNGGAISHGASNFPLRGTKGTTFEGGTRVPTFLLAPQHILPRPQQQSASSVLVHISDWMPTLLKMAGYDGDPSRDLQLDGVDQSEALLTGQPARQEMVYNLKTNPLAGAYRQGPYKIIFGKKFNKQGWYDTDNTALQCSRMIKDKKAKRKEESGRLKKNQKTGRKGRVIELVTSKKIEKTLSGPDRVKRGNWKRRNRRKQNQNRNNKNKGTNKGTNKGKNKGKNKRNQKNKQNKRNLKGKGRASRKKNKKNIKIVSEIFEDKHYDLGFIQRSRNDDLVFESGRSRKKKERQRERQSERDQKKIAKKFNKIWADWLPRPGADVQDLLRLRMENCNWEDFAGHSDDLQLIPRSAFQFGDVVQMIEPLSNPFNISAADEDSEFDYELTESRELDEDEKLERKFENLDIAMYNVIEDPQERNDLSHQLPEIFQELKRNVLRHLVNVVPADFPDQDFSGHPRRFKGTFSPGWCSPK